MGGFGIPPSSMIVKFDVPVLDDSRERLAGEKVICGKIVSASVPWNVTSAMPS